MPLAYGTHGASSTMARSTLAPETRAAAGSLAWRDAARAILASIGRIAVLGEVPVLGVRRLVARARERLDEEALRRRVVRLPSGETELEVNEVLRPVRIGRIPEARVVPQALQHRDDVPARPVAELHPARHPDRDALTERARGAHELPRACEVGSAPLSARARAGRIRAVAAVPVRARGQDLARHPAEVPADGDVPQVLAVDGEVQRADGRVRRRTARRAC